jgi:hypothetical protein
MSFWVWIASWVTIITIIIAVRQLNGGDTEMPPPEDDG